MSSNQPYKLSCELHGHTGDIRAVAALTLPTGTSLLLSASRDRTARVWSRPAGGKAFTSAATLQGHDGYVNSCAFLHSSAPPAAASAGQGSFGASSSHAAGKKNVATSGAEVFALTAGQDKTINAYQVSETGAGQVKISENPDYTLLGHEENVCALDAGPGGSYTVSGSWDKTAKIWKNWKCVATLKGHLQAVWAVLAVDEDKVITASADKTIRLWSISNPSKPLAMFSGHTDVVRSLTLLEGGQAFASCGNDAQVCVYSLVDVNSTNKPILALSGHTSFAYSIAAIGGASGQLASSGEDRSVRIWQGEASGASGTMIQSITLPAVSVWSIAALADGDLASGSNDGVLRVFTRSQDRQATEAEVKAFDAAVASQELDKTQIGDVKLDQMASMDVLSTPGKKEGEVKMVRNGDKGEAYQWTMGSWQKIGDVVGGVGQHQKQIYQGKEYDYVFDVDVMEGAPALKLPYNMSENPYFAAQRFIDKNELPQEFLEQIVKFIDQNSDQNSSSASATSNYVDPYTGASRYSGTGGASANAPPRPAAPATSSSGPYSATGNVDPFTRSAQPSTAAQSAVLPQKVPLGFKQFNPAPVKAKLAQLAEAQGTPAAALTQIVDAVAAGGSKAIDVQLLEKPLQSWAPASRFPLLDVYRVAAGLSTTSSAEQIAEIALQAASWSAPWPADAAQVKERDTNSMLALRALANVFTRADGLKQGLALSPTLVSTLGGSHYSKLGKNGRIAFSTLLMNMTVAVLLAGSAQTWASQLLQLIVEVLSSEEGDSEAVYRALIALGTLNKSPSAGSLSVESVGLAKDLATSWAQRLSAETRVVSVVKELS